MAIQNRRGVYSDFDPDNMVAGELAVVTEGDPNSTTGRSLYVCFEPGVVKRVCDYEDLTDLLVDAADNYIDGLSTAAGAATSAASDANDAATAANNAATAANAAAASAANASKHYFGTNNVGGTTSTASIDGFQLEKGVVVSLYCSVKLGQSLNISNTGAKSVYWRNASRTGPLASKGDVVTLMYDGTRYQIISVTGAVTTPFHMTINNISSLPITKSDVYINEFMVCTHAELSNPLAQAGDWTVTTNDGSMTLSGSVTSGQTTNIDLILETSYHLSWTQS